MDHLRVTEKKKSVELQSMDGNLLKCILKTVNYLKLNETNACYWLSQEYIKIKRFIVRDVVTESHTKVYWSLIV